MPRNVRNFWLEAKIDGRASTLTGGPQGRMGGFSLTIYQRLNATVMQALRIEGFASSDGTIRLSVCPAFRDDSGNAIPQGVSAERPILKLDHARPERGFTIETRR